MDSAGRTAYSFVCVFTLTALCVAAGAVRAQESTSFRIERVTASASAGFAESINFETRIVVSQNSPSGGMASECGNGWIQTAGFFSVLASGPVPIWLTVDRASLDPLEIGLSWTGINNTFEVRRSFDPQTINDPSSLQEVVGTCATADPLPTENNLIYYLVAAEPTAP